MAGEKTAAKQQNNKWRYIALGLAAALALAAEGLFALRLNTKLNLANNRLDEMQAALSEQWQQAQILQQQQIQYVAMADMANRVEELTEGLKTEQEQCLAIARWIAGHISNRSDEGNSYIRRAGLCAARSSMMVSMLAMANIPAKNFNLYDFPAAPGGHTCVQAWYGGAWHFFDVTYAGVFMDGDNVMSFDQIVANPAYALKNMVVFENTLDKTNYGVNSYFDDNMNPVVLKAADNVKRMRESYTLEKLTGFDSYNFADGTGVALVHPVISASEMPYVFGGLDGGWTDMQEQMIASNSPVSSYIAYALRGNNIKSDFTFTDLMPGVQYYLKYYIYEVQTPGSRFFAVPDGVEIVSGQELILSENTTEWTIEFIPNNSRGGVYSSTMTRRRSARALLSI